MLQLICSASSESISLVHNTESTICSLVHPFWIIRADDLSNFFLLFVERKKKNDLRLDLIFIYQFQLQHGPNTREHI